MFISCSHYLKKVYSRSGILLHSGAECDADWSNYRIYCGVTMGCNILYYIQLPHNMPQCIALEQCNTHTEDEAVYEPQCYLTVFGRLAHCGEVFFFTERVMPGHTGNNN